MLPDLLFTPAAKARMIDSPILQRVTTTELSARELLTRSSFSKLPPDLLDAIVREATRIRAPAGGLVIREGDGPAMHLVASGLVRVFLRSANGRQATVRYVRPGNLMGTATLFAGANRVSSQAITETSLYALSVSQIKHMAEVDVRVANALCVEMAARLQDYFGVMAGAHFGTVRQRVVAHLLDVAADSQRGAALVAAVTQQELADAVGSVREVVARVLQELRKEGLVTGGGQGVELLNPVRLQAEIDWTIS
jgi:CRP/FNR family cyclic AMP-dependent transcriptional regulator